MTVSKNALGSDLAKVDAHEITPAEYDELPEIDEAFISRARERGTLRVDPDALIRLDTDLVGRLRKTGQGWQTRANDALRAWADKVGV